MTSYRYETHLHTAESSLCGKSPSPELVRHYHALGYEGIFVTDHFLNGNTTVPHDLPWHERIDWFCRGYDTAAQAGAEVGLQVFFGWEYSHGWAHFLTYGLDKDWLLANPDLLSWDVLDYFDRVHEDGGFVVHAHPFRERIDAVFLCPTKTDAVEIVNAARPDNANRHARDLARSFGLPETAGSDIHSTRQKRLCGVSSPHRFETASDYLQLLVDGEATIVDQTVAACT